LPTITWQHFGQEKALVANPTAIPPLLLSPGQNRADVTGNHQVLVGLAFPACRFVQLEVGTRTRAGILPMG
jgi:hypothetical protein